MDFGDFSDNIPVIITIVVLIVMQFFLRRKRSPAMSNLGIVQGLLSETRLNLRLAEVFSYSRPGKKFMTTTWKLYQNKLEFMDQRLRANVSDTFILLEDYNGQISSAKKFKSTSYLSSIDVDRLEELLAETQEGLEQWLSSREGTEEATPKPPGIFGDFTGRS